MRSSFAILMLTLSSTVVFATVDVPTAPATPVPRVVAAESVHDFGRANVGDRLTTSIELRNEGTAPLEILSMESDCACLTASYDKTIAPGATSALKMVFDTTEMDGALLQKLTLTTNDPAVPTLTFVAKARVPPILTIRPGFARFNYVQKEIPGHVEQLVWASDGQPFEIVSVKSPSPFLITSFREATAEERRPEPEATGKQWRVETVLSPDAPVGPLAAVVEITTNHPKQKNTRFAVSGFVRPVLVVTPDSADFGLLKADHPKLGTLRVEVFSTEEAQVTSAETDVKGLSLQLETARAGRDYRVHVALEGKPRKKGPFTGKIVIHTTSTKTPLVEVPIVGQFE